MILQGYTSGTLYGEQLHKWLQDSAAGYTVGKGLSSGLQRAALTIPSLVVHSLSLQGPTVHKSG